ncbi:MAG: sulfotransferase [Phycisphaerales bacterium]|nr:sulfotransferase [Phycisphaerales bacterium]
MQQPAQQNQPTPQQVFEEAYRLLRIGDVYEAAKRAGKLRMHFPQDVPVLTLHGIVLAQMGVHPQALSDLILAAKLTEEALKNETDENPNRPRIVDQLIRLSVHICRSSVAINEFDAATEAIENALGWDPDRGDAVAAKAELFAKQDRESEALELITNAQNEMLESMPLALSKGKILLGSENTSDDALRASLKELSTEAEVSGLGALDLSDLLRVIGMIHDRLGEFDESFNSFRRAAKLRRGSYDPRSHTMMTTKICAEWNENSLTKLIKPQASGERFVLLLGAPQSGVDELSEMLCQFDGAKVVGPLETLSMIGVKHLGARQGVLRPVPFEPSKFRGAQIKEAGDAYNDQVSPLLDDSVLRAVDTHPHNIPLAGAAATILPGINIVICRRDPMESILSTYCDSMIGNHPYAGDLVNLSGFVTDCNRMLDHWASFLGNESIGANIVEVDYKDLAKDPKKIAAKVAREIGLDARATSVNRVPDFDTGPSTHPEKYASYTKSVEEFVNPVS